MLSKHLGAIGAGWELECRLPLPLLGSVEVTRQNVRRNINPYQCPIQFAGHDFKENSLSAGDYNLHFKAMCYHNVPSFARQTTKSRYGLSMLHALLWWV